VAVKACVVPGAIEALLGLSVIEFSTAEPLAAADDEEELLELPPQLTSKTAPASRNAIRELRIAFYLKQSRKPKTIKPCCHRQRESCVKNQGAGERVRCATFFAGTRILHTGR
jgi:hypothetical protein